MIKECQTTAQLRKLVPKKCEKPVKFKFILPASGNYIKTKNKSEKFKVQNPKRKPKTRKTKIETPDKQGALARVPQINADFVYFVNRLTSLTIYVST